MSLYLGSLLLYLLSSSKCVQSFVGMSEGKGHSGDLNLQMESYRKRLFGCRLDLSVLGQDPALYLTLIIDEPVDLGMGNMIWIIWR
jgi:hypothetical protein